MEVDISKAGSAARIIENERGTNAHAFHADVRFSSTWLNDQQ